MKLQLTLSYNSLSTASRPLFHCSKVQQGAPRPMLKAPWRVLLPLLFPRLYSNCFSLAPLFTALTGTTRPPPWPAGGVRPRLLGCPRLLQEGALCCPADRSCSLHWRCSSCSRWRCAAASRSWRWHCSSCPCRRCAAASHFLHCAQFVQHISSSLHCCCCCCCCKAAAAHPFLLQP